jgi:hypothetical protein
MKQQLHIKVSGGLKGDFVATEERGEGKFVIVREPEPTLAALRERDRSRELTDEEWHDFIAEHGPHMLPADGEG